jgi:hypothetical protein
MRYGLENIALFDPKQKKDSLHAGAVCARPARVCTCAGVVVYITITLQPATK